MLAVCSAVPDALAARRVVETLGLFAEAHARAALGDEWVLGRLQWGLDRQVAPFGTGDVVGFLTAGAGDGDPGAGKMCARLASLLSQGSHRWCSTVRALHTPSPRDALGSGPSSFTARRRGCAALPTRRAFLLVGHRGLLRSRRAGSQWGDCPGSAHRARRGTGGTTQQASGLANPALRSGRMRPNVPGLGELTPAGGGVRSGRDKKGVRALGRKGNDSWLRGCVGRSGDHGTRRRSGR